MAVSFANHKKWKMKDQFHQKIVLNRYILYRSRLQKERILPGHSVTHQWNTGSTAKWYLKKIRAGKEAGYLGMLGSMGHDLIKLGPNHGSESAKIMAKLLEKRMGKKRVSIIATAMARHSVPFVKNGQRLKSTVVADAVFFADRIEALGAYGAFRVSIANGELPERIRAIKRLAKELVPKFGSKAIEEAAIRLILWDSRTNILLARNLGKYDRIKPFVEPKPIDVLPMEKYFPKRVLGVYKRHIERLEEFANALEKREDWAVEIALHFFSSGKKERQLDQLIAGFETKNPKSELFKSLAFNYIFEKIEKA